jgi:5S rRNA maturation endonuclease (ribonuclease M5)
MSEIWKNYKETVLQRLDWQQIYGSLQNLKQGTNGYKTARCPLHDDSKNSFAFHEKDLNWVCFAGCGKGTVFDYLIRTQGGEFKEHLVILGDSLGIKRPEFESGNNGSETPIIDEATVKEFCENLTPEVRQYLNEKRGITDATIHKYQIGWDPSRQRNTIPVRDVKGNVRNIRLYNAKKDDKMLNYTTRAHKYGSPVRLYGVDELVKFKGDTVIICEGEWDRLLLMQEGFMAVTGTAGCGTFRQEWVKYFSGKHVVIMLDCDSEGQKAALGLVVQAFKGADILSIKNVILPLKGTKDDKDVTDAIVKRGFDRRQMQSVIDETHPHEYKREEIEVAPIILESFSDLDDKEYIDKRIQVEITVNGETSESYHAVEQFEVTHCTQRSKGECLTCNEPITVPRGAQEYIGSCMSHNHQVINMLRSMCCKFGQRCSIEIRKKATIKEFFAHQRIKRMVRIPGKDSHLINGKEQDVVERRVYYLSSETVRPGHYLATGWVKTHPKTQAVTFLIEELIPQEDDYQAFQLKDNVNHLKAFQALKLDEIFKDLTNNVTRIYYDDDYLLPAILLTYCSPLYAKFNGEIIHSWLNTIIIGDSGTGKTQTFERINEFISIGDVLSGITSSRTGLAYALVDHKTKGWQIKIGRYPANSGKILVVDEAQFIPQEDLRTISKGMESGSFQVDRVISRSYNCRTRLIMVCNPQNDQVMNAFGRGCESLKSIYPATIIRRVDLAVFLNSMQVGSFAKYNKRAETSQQLITPEMLRAVIYWIWNLPPDAVYFEPEAEKMCLNIATMLAEKFGWCVDIPLVHPADFRNILARVSVAAAGLDVSSDANFSSLIVKKAHVSYSGTFIDCMYSNRACGLDEYSRIKRRNDTVSETEYQQIKEAFESIIDREKHAGQLAMGFTRLLQIMYESSYTMRRGDLAEQAGCSNASISEHIKVFKQFNLIESGKYGYRKTPKFNIMVNKLLNDRTFEFSINSSRLFTDELSVKSSNKRDNMDLYNN